VVPLADTGYGRAALAESHPDWLSRKVWFGEIYEKYLFNTLIFTASMVFRRSLLDEVGFQNVRLGLFEELEFALRLCKAAPWPSLTYPLTSCAIIPDRSRAPWVPPVHRCGSASSGISCAFSALTREPDRRPTISLAIR